MTDTWHYLAPPARGSTQGAAPTLGVLITAHNIAAFLPAALASVFAQTLPPDEVVVCDDASHDDVEGAVEPYSPRLRLVRRATNGGEGAAKNSAVGALSTDVVVVLDGDDEMAPRRLEALGWLAAARCDLDILTTEWEEFGPARPTSPWSLAEHFPMEDQRNSILQWNFLPAPAIRRRALLAVGGFNEDLRYGPDWELHARMLVRGSRAGLITAPLYRYRRWSGQQTSDRRRVLDGRVDVVSLIARDPLLTAHDRSTVARSVADLRSERWLRGLPHDPGGREEALWLVRSPLVSPRRRGLAALAALSPQLADMVARRLQSSGGT